MSHYAVSKNIKSLIILSSGSDCRFFPHLYTKQKKDSYWMNITPCAGCDHIGKHNKCFFKTRYCIDDIFLNKKKINYEFKNFLIKKNQIINFSSINFLISNWVEKNNKKNFFILEKNKFKIKKNKFYYVNYFKNWLNFLLKKCFS